MEYGYFSSGTVPRTLCGRHVLCNYDKETSAIATPGCPSEHIEIIALLDISDRSFPIEVTVTDAEYVWRRMPRDVPYGSSYDVPYFINLIEDGEYVGRSKGKKQFNSSCYLHDD